MDKLDRAVMKEYRRRHSRQLAFAVPAVLVVAAATLLADRVPGGVAGMVAKVITVVVAAALAIFTFSNWRCPQCSAFLGWHPHPRSCEKCGARLRPGLMHP